MLNISQLLNAVESLSVAERWQLVRHVLQTLENDSGFQDDDRADWHTFLQETYGSMRDAPIQRYEQGAYEVRESLD